MQQDNSDEDMDPMEPGDRADTFRRIGPRDLYIRRRDASPDETTTSDQTGSRDEWMPMTSGTSLRTSRNGSSTSPSLPQLPPGDDEPPARPPCPQCGGSGWYLLAVRYNDPRFGKLQSCDCAKNARAEAMRTKRDKLLGNLVKDLGPKLSQWRLETFNLNRPIRRSIEWGQRTITEAGQRESLRKAYRAACDYARAPVGWLALFGPKGSGKSMLSAGIALEVASRAMSVAYTSVPELVDYLREGLGDHSTTRRIQALQEVDLLVADDLGTEVRDPRVDEWLYKIFNARSRNWKSTVISTNANPDQIESRIADRINEDAQIVYVVATSYREEIQRARQAEAQGRLS